MDHLEFYNLKELPFSTAVDTRYYYNSSHHSEALLRLKYAVDTMKGLAVLVGGLGTGKTTLARRMLNELDEDNYEAALLVVIHTSVTSEWLMKKIAVQLGIENVSDNALEILNQLYRRFVEIYESGRKTVILMDEVQMLQSREIMEEFRGLLNMEGPGGKLVTLVFFGLPELDDVMGLDEPLKQRVAVKYTLTGFDENMTQEYIRHRLTVAGCTEEIFAPDALSAVHHHSRGIPRLINTVCDNAIFEGYLLRQKPVSREIIDQVASNLALQPAE